MTKSGLPIGHFRRPWEKVHLARRAIIASAEHEDPGRAWVTVLPAMFDELQRRRHDLPASTQELADEVLARQNQIRLKEGGYDLAALNEVELVDFLRTLNQLETELDVLASNT